jgi:hypothetical protein
MWISVNGMGWGLIIYRQVQRLETSVYNNDLFGTSRLISGHDYRLGLIYRVNSGNMN